MKIGSGKARENLAEDARLRMEPQLPYVYLPSNTYKKFMDVVNQRYSNEGYTVCGDVQKDCFFNKPCKGIIWDEIISFRLDDGVNLGHSLMLPFDRMLVDSELMGDTPGKCYIPVFDHGLDDTEDS